MPNKEYLRDTAAAFGASLTAINGALRILMDKIDSIPRLSQLDFEALEKQGPQYKASRMAAILSRISELRADLSAYDNDYTSGTHLMCYDLDRLVDKFNAEIEAEEAENESHKEAC